MADSNKEDVLRIILDFIQDGIIVRFNHLRFRTRYYGKRGGLGRFKERLMPTLEACQRLNAAYPEYGEIMTNKTGMTEFRLKRIRSKITSDV